MHFQIQFILNGGSVRDGHTFLFLGDDGQRSFPLVLKT